VLGARGFSSRLMSRVRSDRGYAYSVASIWTTPSRHFGLIGATTRTSPDNAARAVELILETMEELRSAPPADREVEDAIESIVNGFVFAFEAPGQIVARTMMNLAQGLPDDWLTRYIDGVQEVTASSVHGVFADNLNPSEMTVLIVGDTARMNMEMLAEVGEVGEISFLLRGASRAPAGGGVPAAGRR